MADDPTPEPTPPALSGWQWLIYQGMKMVIPILGSVIASLGVSYLVSAQATRTADQANQKAEAAHKIASERPHVVYAAPPK